MNEWSEEMTVVVDGGGWTSLPQDMALMPKQEISTDLEIGDWEFDILTFHILIRIITIINPFSAKRLSALYVCLRICKLKVQVSISKSMLL